MTPVLLINKQLCRLIDFPAEIYKIVYNELSYRDGNVFMSPAFRKGYWDGYTRLYRRRDNSFKVGLLYRVYNILKAEKIAFEIVDERDYEQVKLNLESLDDGVFTLRPEQREAILQFCTSNYIAGKIPLNRGIFNIPPRVGKTILLGYLGKALNAFPFVFLNQRIDLVQQSRKVFTKLFGHHIGIIGNGMCDVNSPVIVATVQSVCLAFDIKVKKGEFLETEKVTNKEAIRKLIARTQHLGIDEVHHSSSDSFQDLTEKLGSCHFVTGLSGTAETEKGDSMKMEQLCGPIIYSLTRKHCVDKGYILPIDVNFIKLPLKETSSEKKDFQSIKAEAITTNTDIDKVVQDLVRKLKRSNKSSVVMVNEKKQGDRLAALLKVPYLHGGVKGHERAKVYDLLNRKKILTIVSTVTDEGVDLVTLDVCIIASIRKSVVSAWQRFRCATPSEGKTKGIVYIIYPDADYIRSHAAKLYRVYSKDPTVTIRKFVKK